MNSRNNQSPRSFWTAAAAALVVLATSAVPPQVLADDTDVFFPVVQSTNQGLINPNILFMLDTSGSMSTDDYAGKPTCSGSQVPPACDDGKDRMTRLKEAMAELLTGATKLGSNVNIGLGRFSQVRGAAILFPVAPIDAPADDQDFSGVGGDRNQAYQTTVEANGSKLSEANEAFNGTVTMAPNVLSAGDNLTLLNPTATGSMLTTGDDEAEEYSSTSNGTDGAGGPVNGGNTRCADQLNMANDNTSRGGSSTDCYKTNVIGSPGTTGRTPGEQTVGIRFSNFSPGGIPQGATIISASIKFVIPTTTNNNGAQDNANGITIFGEKVVNSAVFKGGASSAVLAAADASRPSKRLTSKTTASMFWHDITTSTGNASTINATTPSLGDLTAIVQELVNQATWTSTSPMTFLMKFPTTGFRRTFCGARYQTTATSTSVVSSNACGAGKEPVLSVNYTTPGTDNSKSKIVGLRFQQVHVPQGVTLAAATLTLHADTTNSVPMTVNIAVQDADDAAPFSAVANGISGAGRSYTSGILWSMQAFTTADDDYVSPDIAAELNKVIKNRPGWCGGNSLVITLTFTNGSGTAAIPAVRNIVGKNQDANLAPLLNLAFDPTTNAAKTGCDRSSLASQISAPQSDDSFEVADTNKTNFPACAVLHLGATPSASTCGSTGKKTITGLRFSNLNIPKNAKIINASIQLTGGKNTDNTTASLTITGEATSTPATFGTANSFITGLQTTPGATGATVAWSPPSSSDGFVLTTPELKTIVQEIVDRADWAANNPMGFFITGADTIGSRTIKAVETSASLAPKLSVTIEGQAGRQTVRQYIAGLVPGFPTASSTPTMGALYEAGLYYRGDPAYYGRTRGEGSLLEGTEPGTSTARVNGRMVYDYTVSSVTHNFPAGCTDFNLASAACSKETWTGTTIYKSPVTDACQSNNIILLSDGEPNSGNYLSGDTGNNKSSEQLIAALTPVNSGGTAINIGALPAVTGQDGVTLPAEPSSDTTCVGATSTSSSSTQRNNCGNELAYYLDHVDQVKESKIAGTQVVVTHTIGFGADVADPALAPAKFLHDLASYGGGLFKVASTASELGAAFTSIISSIIDKGSTFVAPAVTINTFNKLTHRNELYFALFKPSSGLRWEGNLKRYKLDQKTTDTTPQIYGTNNVIAVDGATGFFKDTAQSFWSSSVDGKDVKSGGAASTLGTDIGLYTFKGTPNNSTLKSIKLDSATTIANVSETDLGIPGPTDIDTTTATERINVLKWASGLDQIGEVGTDKTAARKRLADPLHSEPVLVSYLGDQNTADTNTDDPLINIYFGTNDGLFHGINADTGTQNWAFIPSELLPNLHSYYENDGLHTVRPYGMDGPVTPYVNDGDGDGDIIKSKTDSTPDTYTVKVGAGNVSRNDFAYLYAGTRRGGGSRGLYYAFDVTDRTSPKIKFKIVGGSASFPELGQTWSRAIPVNIRVNGTDYPDDLDLSNASSTQKKKAILFSGGYDPVQDGKTSLYTSAGAAIADSQGRALYLVDADDGTVLWSASGTGTNSATHLVLSNMNFSTPASPLPLDLDADGFVDRIYFADTGGQIFRIMLGKDGSNKDSLSNATGGVIARLASFTASANPAIDSGKNARRFFNTPDVALIKAEADGKPFLSIAIGSGWREKPLDLATEDRFYILRDPDVVNSTSPALSGVITDANLVDVTTELNSTTIKTAIDGGKNGVYIRLVPSDNTLKGEKALTESTTFNNQVIFATFTPPSGVDNVTNKCTALQGKSKFYQINVEDATPVQNFDAPTDTTSPLTVADRSVTLSQAGLPPDPVVIFPSISSSVASDGTQTICTGSTCISQNPLVFIGTEAIPVNSPRRVRKTYWQKIEP